MKRLFLIGLVFLTTVSGFAETNRAIVFLSPIQVQDESGECMNDSTKIENNQRRSAYDKCKERNKLKYELKKYFTNHLKDYIYSSDNIELTTSKTGLTKIDYSLVCDEINFICDEVKSSSIIFIQINCDLVNINTGELINVSEYKTKFTYKNYIPTFDILMNGCKKSLKFNFDKLKQTKELENAIEKDIKFENASFEYIFNDKNKKYANGKETGKLDITELVPGYISNHHALTEFTLRAKQGKFIESNSKEIKFTDHEYLKKNKKISFPYKTYNCQDKEIEDKKFETFTLKVTSQLTKEKSVLVKEFQAPFECQEPYYTVTTSQKITSHLKVLENYRGINKDLKSYQEDKSTYYIYIDADKAMIEQYHVDKKSTRKIHREKYVLNYKSCQYEIEKEDKLIKNMGGSDILKSEDAGWGFEDDTKIYVVLPSSEKELSFTWGRLKETGHYSNNKKYKKKIPEIAKKMMGKMNDITALFRKESKNNKGMELWKSLYDYPGAAGSHVQCGGKVTMETFLIPPLDGLQDPDVDFSIKIRPSTKNEIKIMKAYMKKESVNPADFLKVLELMQGAEK